MKITQILFLIVLKSAFSHAQEVDTLIENIYRQNLQQEQKLMQMSDYLFKQRIDFIKKDGDGDIDEQSQREFVVYVRPPDQQKRILIKARDYADGEWQDITEKRRSGRHKGEGNKFSLNEIFNPEARKNYLFNYQGVEWVDGHHSERIQVTALEAGENRFNGELWFARGELDLVKAILSPSELPGSVDSMQMVFDMQKVNGYWVPKHIEMRAEISFLFFFSGIIESDILFYDYQFNQQFPDSIFDAGTQMNQTTK